MGVHIQLSYFPQNPREDICRMHNNPNLMGNQLIRIIGGILLAALGTLLVGVIVQFLFGDSAVSIVSFSLSLLGLSWDFSKRISAADGSDEGGGLNISLTNQPEVNSQYIKNMSERGRTDWEGKSNEEILDKIESDPLWRLADDSSYESQRQMGRGFVVLSNFIRKFDFITPRRLSLVLTVVPIFGATWFMLIFTDLIASTSLSHPIYTTIAAFSPIEASTQNFPIYQMIFSVILFAGPVAYVTGKRDMSCSECNSPFSLKSIGKYWHPDLRTEIIHDSSKTVEYEGIWFFRCDNCGKLIQNDTCWTDER